MIRIHRWQNAAGPIALIALLALAAGCSKQLSSWDISKVDGLLAEARKFNAEKHAKPQYDQAVQLRNQADQERMRQDFKTAHVTGKQAVATARDVLATAKRMEATEQKNIADHEVVIMGYNNGAKENAELYQQILDIQKKMEQRYNKESWEKTIELADDIKKKVEQLLARLRNQADADLVEVNAEYKRLIDEGGQIHAGTFVQRVTDLIKQIQDQINPSPPPPAQPIKNYVRASALAKEAMRDAQEGIIESKRKKCEIEIQTIQGKLIRAKVIGAERLQLALWEACSDDFTKLIDFFWKKEYDFVLNASKRLNDEADKLIYETRRASAMEKRDELTKLVANMKAKGVPDYIPGSMTPLDKALETANGQFDKEAYEDVEQTCFQATTDAGEIMKKFRALADDWLLKAKNIFGRAQDVFKDMQRIFTEIPTTYNKPMDQRFEENKQAMKADMGRRLTNAQSNLAVAETKLTATEYRDTIELSRAVQDEATSILATIYNVVAYNVIVEILDEVTRYDREGAQEYANAEMGQTKKLIQEAIVLRDRGEFQAAASKAAEARAQLESTIQTIEVAATKAIETAQAELKKSDQAKTAELRPEDYQRAQGYINEARLQLTTKRLIDSIHTAQRAAEVSRQGAQDASRIWATQAIKEGNDSLGDAQQAGADIYAAELLRRASEDEVQANKMFESADALLGQKKFDEATQKFLEAKTLAVQAAEGAHRAKFRNIDEAEAAVVEARSYGGWREQLGLLTDAVISVDQAKEAMAAGQFLKSQQLAKKAADQANKVTGLSKNGTFAKRLEVVDGLLNEATRSGGRYYEAKLLTTLVHEVDKVREQYNPQQFDSNAKQVAEIESKLQGILDAMPGVVSDWIRRQNERIAAVEKSDVPPTFAAKISDARKFFRFAELDFKQGKYRSSYENMLVGRRILDELETDRAETEYRRAGREVFDSLQQAMQDFDQFLSLNPKMLTALARGSDGDRQFVAIAGKASPADFRARLDSLLVKVQGLQPPSTMNEFHKELVTMLSTARAAAIYYERLTVLKEFDVATRKDIIQKAYDLMNDVRARRAELEKELLPRSVETQKI